MNRADLLAGDGEMARRVREFDWSATPVGPAESWPQSLRIAVGIMLKSRYPMFIWWGRELINLYNDGCVPMFGNRHPDALGKPAGAIWSEIWETIGPQADAVLHEGRATWNEERLLVLERNGYPEEAYFTFSCSPVAGDSGGIGGLFCALTEDTQRLLSHRRLNALQELAARTMEEANSEEQACETAAQVLAGHRCDLPFALIYLLDEGAPIARLASAMGLEETSPAAPRCVDLAASNGEGTGWPLRTVLESGRAEVVTELGRRFGALPGGIWPEPAHTAVLLPIMKSGQERLAGWLVAGVSPRRELDESYRVFFELLATHIAAGIACARAYEQERKRAAALAELDRAKEAVFVDRVRREAFLREEELRTERDELLARLQLQFDRMPIACIVADPQMRIMEWNPAAEMTFGYRREEVVGKDGCLLLVPPARRPYVQEVNRRLASGDMTAHGVNENVTKDGRIILCEWRNTPLRNAGGETIAILATAQDITERKEAEEKLRRSESFLAEAQQIARTGSWSWDIRSNEVIWSDEHYRLYGLNPKEGGATYERGANLIHPDDRAIVQDRIQQALRDHQPFEVYWRTLHEDGTIRFAHTRGQVELDEQGEPVRMFGIMQDITERKQAERALIESEAKFRTLADASPAIIWFIDPNGHGRYVNRTCLEFVGKSEEAIWGEGWHSLLHPDDAPTYIPKILEAVREHRPFRGHTRVRRHDQQWRWFESQALPHFGEDGRYLGHVGHSLDITDSLEANASVRESEERITQLVSLMPAAVYTCDAEGRITFYNRRAAELWGRAPELGTKDEKFCGSVRLWRPDGSLLPHPETPMATAIFEGRSARNTEVVVEQPNGARVVVSVNIDPLYNQEGGRAGAINVFEDITERKRAEEALRKSEKNLAAELTAMTRLQEVSTRLVQAGDSTSLLQEIVDAAIAITAADMGKIQLFDRDSGTLRIVASRGFESPFLQYFNRIHEGQAASGAALHEGVRVVIEDVHTSPVFEGTALDVVLAAGVRAVQSTPLVSRSGRLVGTLSTHYRLPCRPADRDLRVVDLLARQAADWIERTQAEQALRESEEERKALLASERDARCAAEQANRLKDDFLATLSHELRTPMSAVLGWVHLMRTGTLDAATVHKALDVMERGVKTQVRLIDDLLDVSRITSGKLHIQVGHVDLASVVQAAIDTVMPAANAKGITIRRMLDRRAPLRGDATRLQQVFWNLLSNAIKFTPERGSVDILLERIESRLIVSVCDTGQGIHPEFLQHIFERFRQADSTAARKHGGLGLGLAIVKHLVELHGGSVRAESEGEGRGTTMIVSLPVWAGAAESLHDTPSPALDDKVNLASMRILFVDDDRDTRIFISRMLAECNAQIETASSADEALRRLSTARPDVMISDIGMPGKDGYELIREIRRSPEHKRLPAVALTAFARAEDRIRALKAGYNMHVAKPIDPRELLAVLASLVPENDPEP